MRFRPIMCSLAAIFVAALFFSTSCRRASSTEPESVTYVPVATVKDLMLALVDPSADVVWNSVAAEVTLNETRENTPDTEEEWATVRQGAIRLVEAANLLAVPGRHVAAPGEKSEAPGAELEPAEMEALIRQDPAEWLRRVGRLRDAATGALKSIDAKDAGALFDVGEQIERACEGCHSHYWYPNDKLPPDIRRPTE